MGELVSERLPWNYYERHLMSDPNLHLLEGAAIKLAPFLPEIVFVGGVTLGPVRLDTVESYRAVQGWLPPVAYFSSLLECRTMQSATAVQQRLPMSNCELATTELPITRQERDYTSAALTNAMARWCPIPAKIQILRHL